MGRKKRMTEAAWLACAEPYSMLEFLRGRASDRKLRLFACACCRRVWALFEDERKRGLDWAPDEDERSRNAVEVSERYADGTANAKELKAAKASAGPVSMLAAIVAKRLGQ